MQSKVSAPQPVSAKTTRCDDRRTSIPSWYEHLRPILFPHFYKTDLLPTFYFSNVYTFLFFLQLLIDFFQFFIFVSFFFYDFFSFETLQKCQISFILVLFLIFDFETSDPLLIVQRVIVCSILSIDPVNSVLLLLILPLCSASHSRLSIDLSLVGHPLFECTTMDSCKLFIGIN